MLHPGTIAARDPDRLAVVIGDAVLSYGNLDTQSRAIAAKLHAMGLDRSEEHTSELQSPC